MSASRILAASAVLTLGVLLFVASLQYQKALRFDLGSMDHDYLADRNGFYPRLRLNGPFRRSNSQVEVIDFYGRLTREEAVVSLPYHAVRTPLRIRVRCHRFGLDGTVTLTVNGERVSDFVFTERSYPWGGIEAVVPERVAARGPLRIELRVRDGKRPPPHLPQDLGLGIDLIDIEPLLAAAFIRPSAKSIALVLLWGLLGYLFARVTRAPFRQSLAAMAAILGAIALLNAFFPIELGMALRRLWVAFPLGMLIQLLFKRAFLSRLFVLVTLAHSALIFAPNHAPPDLWNHLPQVEWLDSLTLTGDELRRFSTSSDVSTDGHVRPHFGAAYGAPYPPFFYFLTFALTKIHADGRFLIEFLPVVLGAMMTILIYFQSRVVWGDEIAARLAAVLLALEISLWHHVHRLHSPGVFGEVFVMGLILFLLARHETLGALRGRIVFSGLSAAALLAYAAPVVQLVILVGWIVLLGRLAPQRAETKTLRGLIIGFGAGAAAAVLVYYGPYALDALAKKDVLLERGTYDSPAVFFFLRNQMRDTVRILWNGYPIYVALSVIGYLSLRKWKTAPFPTLVLASCGFTYVTMLVLKDPILLPRLFLHAKEDLFYAPIACLLGALPLAALWRRGRAVAVLAVLLGVFALAARDQWLNANTLEDRGVELLQD